MVSPLGALGRGIVAGAVGSAAQSAFFKLAQPIAPEPPEGAFQPPEAEQRQEGETETVARRAVEQFAQRGPLAEDQKALAGQLVHYGFGAAWGGLYGLGRETVPALRNPLGMAAFGAAVWAISDNAILPLIKLAAPPTRYPAKSHAFALGAHLVYGAAVGISYELMRPRTIAAAGAGLWLMRARAMMRTRLPRAARPLAMAFATGIARGLANRPIAQAVKREVSSELH